MGGLAPPSSTLLGGASPHPPGSRYGGPNPPPCIGVLWGAQLGSYRGPTPPLLGPYQEGLARPLETCHKGSTPPLL